MNNNGGFTLIELILVTVIIGILAGMVVTTFGGRVAETQDRVAKGDIKMLGNQVELYALDNNDMYPPSLDALLVEINQTRAYIKEPATDPWGNPYNYVPGTSTRLADYQIFSSGPDGTPGNEDDVTSQSVLQ